jgi:hypothetical protein
MSRNVTLTKEVDNRYGARQMHARADLASRDGRKLPPTRSAPSRGGTAVPVSVSASILALQRTAGNRATLRALGLRPNAPVRNLARCGAHCTCASCSVKNEEEEKRFPTSVRNLSIQRVVSSGNPRLKTSRVHLQRDGDGPHQDQFVGQNKLVDPNDRTCSLIWTLGGPQWLTPSGVACDPGMLRIPASGDPAQYPSDYPQPDPAAPQTLCPPGSIELWPGTCSPITQAPPPLPVPAPVPESPGDYPYDPNAPTQAA